MYLIIDCNNFFVSCEKVFNPHLEGKPVVVAGNNGGCIVARSNEAKALGLKMSQPLFLCKDILHKNSVITLKTNFKLYQDMSRRVMEVIKSFGFTTEIYSIDEAFVKIKNKENSIALEIRKAISLHTGITVSIGIAPTKTLAKLANIFAKKKKGGIHILDQEEDLRECEIQDVWGIGKKTTEKLQSHGIYNVVTLIKKNKTWIQQHFGIPLLKTYLELHSYSCIELTTTKPLQSITHSRNFTRELLNLNATLKELYSFCKDLCFRLRENKLKTRTIQLKISSSPFKKGSRMKESKELSLHEHSNYTPHLHAACQVALTSIYMPSMQIKKMQLTFCDLVSEEKTIQKNLLYPVSPEKEKNQHTLMQIMDKTNKRYGNNSLFIGIESIQQIAQNNDYTTDLEQILVIDIDKPISYT